MHRLLAHELPPVGRNFALRQRGGSDPSFRLCRWYFDDEADLGRDRSLMGWDVMGRCQSGPNVTLITIEFQMLYLIAYLVGSIG